MSGRNYVNVIFTYKILRNLIIFLKGQEIQNIEKTAKIKAHLAGSVEA